MTQEDRLDYLLSHLAGEYENVAVLGGYKERRDFLQGLMNTRPPVPIDTVWLKVQDAFLSQEREEEGVTRSSELPACEGTPQLVLWQGDITRLEVDAIVNAANAQLLGCFIPNHTCIDNVIHARAGFQLRLACHELMQAQGHEEPTGQAQITSGYNLPARYVVHTVGPIISGEPTQEDCDLLASCYASCLQVAADAGCTSIAFCCISTGEFHFPNQKAAEIAVSTVQKLLPQYPTMERVIFNVFLDKDREIYEGILG